MEQKYLLSADVIVDQQRIKDIALHHEKWQYRKLAVAYITDEQVLQYIVAKDKVSAVKHVAVQRMHNVNMLGDIILSGTTSDIRKAAVNQLVVANEFQFLISLFPKIHDWWLRTNIIQQLPRNLNASTNRGLEVQLCEIAITDKNKYVRESAVKKIRDSKLLFKIATSDVESTTAKLAIQQLTDEQQLLVLRMLLPNALQHEVHNQLKLL